MPQVPLADGIYPWVLYLKNLYLFLKTNPGSSVLLPGKSHGRRSLVGCSREESDMTERLHFHFSLSCIGEGNGNPLQCSCQENPRDGGAWWAATCGVAQSRTPQSLVPTVQVGSLLVELPGFLIVAEGIVGHPKVP